MWSLNRARKIVQKCIVQLMCLMNSVFDWYIAVVLWNEHQFNNVHL